MNPKDNTPKKPQNRPGLPKIAYRISDYAGFRRRLLNLLPSILLPSGAKSAPLAKLTTRLEDDPAIALLDAWAVVAEVLTFYQERIANEGYLRTATERRSILELARAIGYELKPGVAASTFLTFTVEDAPGSPKLATIPKGTQIMSVPGKDELPQTFETSEEFIAHVDWNVIKPRSSRPQEITSDTHQLYLNGISTQLKAGDYLLLVDEDREIRTYLLSLTDVKEDAQAGYTLIKWEQYLNHSETPLRNPKVFAFRQKANLFGYNAPDWEDMSAEVKLAAIEAAKDVPIQWGVFNSSDNGKQWQSASKGLPNEDIVCLAAKKGIIFAGTPSKGVFRSQDNGNTWEPANNGLTNLNIKALYINQEHDNSPIFAGTPGGGVFRSKDNGDTWVPINIGSVRVESQPGSNTPTNWRSINTSLPNTIVRSLLTYDNYIFVGTDDGIFRSTNQGKDWEPKNLSNRAVYSLLLIDCVGTGKIESSGLLGIKTTFKTQLQPGDTIILDKQTSEVSEVKVKSVASDYALILDSKLNGEKSNINFDFMREGTGMIASNAKNILIGIDTSFTSKQVSNLVIKVGSETRRIINAVKIKDGFEEITIGSPFNNKFSSSQSFVIQLYSGFGVLDNSHSKIIIQESSLNVQENDILIISNQSRSIVNLNRENGLTLTVNPPFDETESIREGNVNFQVNRQGDGIITNAVIKGINTTFLSKISQKFQSKDTFLIENQTVIVENILSDTLLIVEQPLEVLTKDASFKFKRRGNGTLNISDRIITVSDTKLNRSPRVGDVITVAEQVRKIVEVSGEDTNPSFKLDRKFDPPVADGTTIYLGRSLFAGTDRGVYCSPDLGDRWYELNKVGNDTTALAQKIVYSLVSYRSINNKHFIFAGTNEGVYYSANCGENWESINNSTLASSIVYSLEVYEDADNIYLFAATNKGIFVLTNSNEGNDSRINWNLFSHHSTQSFTALALEASATKKQIFAGSKFTGFVTSAIAREQTNGIQTTTRKQKIEWPNFQITDMEQIDLDTLYPQIIKDSWFVLFDDRNSQSPEKRATPGVSQFCTFIFKGTEETLVIWLLLGVILQNWDNLATPRFFASRVENISTISRRDFGLNGKITRIESNLLVKNAEYFGLRSAIALIRSEELELAKELLTVSDRQQEIFLDPIQGKTILLNSFIQKLQNNQTLIVSGKSISIQLDDVGGVFQATNNGTNLKPIQWAKVNQGLTNSQVTALTRTSIRTIAGTTEGIFYSSDNGNYWKPVVGWSQVNQKLNKKDIQALLTFTSSNLLELIFVGTAEGIFRSKDLGDKWEEINQGLTYRDIRAIHIYGNKLLVGTINGGVFQSENNGGSWTTTGLNNTDVQALAIQPHSLVNQIFAGTIRDGIFHSKDGGTTWHTINTGLTNLNITALVTGARKVEETVSINGKAVTSNEIIFTELFKIGDTITIANNSNSTIAEYTRVIQSITNTTLSVNKDFLSEPTTATSFIVNIGLLFAGTSGSGVFRSKDNGDRWEQININLTDLEIRCLTVDANQNVWVGTASGGVFYSDNQGELWQPINTNLTNIDVRSILIPDKYSVLVGCVGILQPIDASESKPVQRRDVLQLLEPPASDPNAPPNYKRWKLMDKDGFQGYLTTISSEEVTLLPAAEDSEFVSEVVKIQSPPTDQQMPVLTLQEPLKNAYDPTTVKIYGNVVEATHGETIEEVLGSGDGNLINQRFTLKKPPLTYVSNKSASGADSTLEVRVNGILWQEVPSLYSLTAQNKSYIIRIEDDGTTNVTFGDGIQGSRLPTGEENITATYRSGIGLDGNIGVDHLSLLKTRPLGITEVTNPVPATGAAARESLAEARTKAPSTVRILDRIVSLLDFEDFARGFAGIGKAQAVEIWHEETQLVHITIAGVNGAEVLRESKLYQNLIAAIELARDPLQKVQVDSYDRLLFNLEAKLLLDPRYQAEEIENKVIAALKSTFAFERRRFGQAVTESEVVAIIQKIEGVVAVDLDTLYQVGSSKDSEKSLMALKARSDPQTNQVRPAQLLLLNPAGIKLIIVSTL